MFKKRLITTHQYLNEFGVMVKSQFVDNYYKFLMFRDVPIVPGCYRIGYRMFRDATECSMFLVLSTAEILA